MKFARFYKIEKVIVSAETICENTVTVFFDEEILGNLGLSLNRPDKKFQNFD